VSIGVAGEIVPLGGVAAKLNKASKTPAEQRKNALRTRGLIRPDSDVEVFMVVILNCEAACGTNNVE
jgi:hypothetical protein